MKKSLCIFLIFMTISIDVFAENSTFYYKIAVESFKAGDLSDAEKNFKLSLQVNPSYTLGHYGLGRVYILQKGKVPDAIKHFKSAVNLDHNFVRGWFKLGLAELISGKYMDSLHSFKEAYNLDKTYIEALYNMGVIYDLLGDDYKAFTFYRLYYRKIKGEKDEFF